MADRINLSSNTEWEKMFGYSRAVRIGNIIEVAGTTAVENGQVVGIGDAYSQTIYVIKKIQKYLNKAGADLKDVVRTRMYVTDISKGEEIGKAHSEYFKDILPAATMVEVKSLINPALLIEIEVTAIIQK